MLNSLQIEKERKTKENLVWWMLLIDILLVELCDRWFNKSSCLFYLGFRTKETKFARIAIFFSYILLSLNLPNMNIFQECIWILSFLFLLFRFLDTCVDTCYCSFDSIIFSSNFISSSDSNVQHLICSL